MTHPLLRGGQPSLDISATELDTYRLRLQRQLTTIEGWRESTACMFDPHMTLCGNVQAELQPGERIMYNATRLAYHAEGRFAETPATRTVMNAMNQLSLQRQSSGVPRRPLVISGPAGVGKSVALTVTAARFEATVRSRYSDSHNQAPVVYIVALPGDTARSLLRRFARFFALPFGSRSVTADLLASVCGVMNELHSQIVCIDDAHYLLRGGDDRAKSHVWSALGYIAQHVGAMFAFASSDTPHKSWSTSMANRYPTPRAQIISVGAYPDGIEWQALVSSFEDNLRLLRHTPRSLSTLAPYLHQRTKGLIGNLSRLVCTAAVRAILDGTECITEAQLDNILVKPIDALAAPLDHTDIAERTDDLPRALPLKPKPHAGESVDGYVHRLAAANHMRPSVLQIAARGPHGPTSALSVARLSTLTGHAPSDLTRTLTGLGETPRTRERTGPLPTSRESAEQRAALLGVIRHEAAQGASIRELAIRHHVHRRTVRQALAGAALPQRAALPHRAAPAVDPVRDILEALADQDLTARQIWATLIDDYGARISYSTVSGFVSRRRGGNTA